MLKDAGNAYFLAKIGADTAENEQHFAEILPSAARAPRHLRPQRQDSLRGAGFSSPFGGPFPAVSAPTSAINLGDDGNIDRISTEVANISLDL